MSRTAFKQDWNAPGLDRDILIAALQHLAWNKQDAFQIAEIAKDLGGWEFSANGL